MPDDFMKKFDAIEKIVTEINFKFEYGNKEKNNRYLFSYEENR